MGKPSKEKTAIIEMLGKLETILQLVKIDKEDFDNQEMVLTEKIRMLNELLNTNKEQK